MKKLGIVLALVVTFLAVGFSVLRWYARRTVAENVKRIMTANMITRDSSEEQKARALSRYSEIMELAFPPDSELLFACNFKSDFPDPYVFAVKLQINPSDLDSFYKEIEKHTEIEGHIVNMPDKATWYGPFYFDCYNPGDIWQADNVKNEAVYSIVYGPASGDPILGILVDLDRPDSAMIYLYYASI